jgi:hypothetical protein
MDTTDATRGYESWLGGLAELHRPDLDYKHERMADPHDPFPFFRGTYYLWALRWARAAGDLADAPAVLAVGDLHLENYGTWRDADGRLCWGVNDFDEADRLPYTADLARLAVSVRLARRSGASAVKTAGACRAVLAGYREALEAGGTPFVLEERHRRLRALAMHADREPARFWKRLTALLDGPPNEPPAEARAALVRELPAEGLSPQFRFRPRAGMGSLGKPRYVALARWDGSWTAREAKALTPPATAWSAGGKPAASLAAEAAGRAARCPDPSYKPGPGWVLRRLGPRCSRIELAQLRHAGDLPRLLRAMGAEAANVHLGTPGAAALVLADLARRPAGWLADAARSLARLVERDWQAWRASRRVTR